MTEREFAILVVQQLRDAGFQALWAGGCVRDELLGLVPKDYDIATDARPEQVRKLFRRTVAVGISFGVVEVIGPKVDSQHLLVQVATFRSDCTYSDGRRPDAVVFSSPEEDAQRRDFTINGMFFDPLENQLIDFVGGKSDLQNRILRAIGNPFLRFEEDKLRLLRAARIATRFALDIEPETEKAIKKMAEQIKIVSAERIAEELRQLLVHPLRLRGVNLLWDLGLIKPIFPELVALKGFSPKEAGFPDEDLWDHVLKVIGFLEKEVSFPLALAALLHEVGKPALADRKSTDGENLNSPEEMGAVMAADIADRLRLSNAEKERVVWLVGQQRCLRNARQLRKSKLKQILIHPGIHELLALHRAEVLAQGKSTDDVKYCEKMLNTWTEEEINPAPLLNGNDLKDLGLKPGPRFKELLDALRKEQLEGTIANRDQALGWIKKQLAM